MKALFLVNTSSGPMRKRDLHALIRTACRLEEFDTRPCGPREELDQLLATAHDDGFDAVVAVGGDGTVHEIARRLVGTTLALGIIPTGSGNGFARHLGISCIPQTAVRGLDGAERFAIDSAEVNGRTFIGIMGIGLEAAIAARFAAHPARGLRTYLLTALRTIASHRAEEIEVVADGQQSRHRVVTAAIANSSQYGNNAHIAPEASVCDGLLDLVLVGDVGIAAAAVLGVRLFTRSMHKSRAVTTIRGREFTIRRVAAGSAHLDGEPVELPAELRIRVRPGSLNVLVSRPPR